MLIVIFNSLWDEPLNIPETLPPGCSLLADPSMARLADVVVFHLPSLPLALFEDGSLTKSPGQRWVAWSMECERHYPQMADPVFLSVFDLRMTYRLNSDVPVTYVPAAFAEDVACAHAGCLPFGCRSDVIANAFISSSYDRSGRQRLLRELMEQMPIDSYGSQARNVFPGAKDDGIAFKLATIARYKFTLAFENACAPDYVTEKFFQPLMVGSVPVVLGAPNIEAFAPGDHCYIDVRDFDSAESLARFLQELAADEERFQRFQSWRSQPLRPGFLALQDRERCPAWVRLCAVLLSQLLR